MSAPKSEDMSYKGDTVIGNDVLIGQNTVILPGVHLGDGAIIGAKSVEGSNVELYIVVVGNAEMEWCDKTIEKIDELIPILTISYLEKVKEKIKKLIVR